MYRSIVRSRVRRIFDEANVGNWQAMLDGLADRFSYRFVGDTPLGGTRTEKATMALWWQRLFRLFPDAKFKPEVIVVEGPPWNTTVMTYVKINGTIPSSGGSGNEPYENEFMQVMTIRWGRITRITTIEDTQRFVRILPLLTANGIVDADAAPLTDRA